MLEEVGRLKWLARPDRVAVDTYDERFTTVIAEQNLRGSRRCARASGAAMVDAAAATVILQSWLEANA